MSDERLGLPSASASGRYALCPGSWRMEQQAPEEPASEDANIGTRVHAVLAHEHVPNLTEEEQSIVDQIRAHETNLLAATFKRDLQVADFREQRLWWLDSSGNKRWSGKPDVVYCQGDVALIIDYKTGRNAVESAAENQQLRCLVALVDQTWRSAFKTIWVAIIQPFTGAPSVALYETADIAAAVAESVCIMGSILEADSRRVPSAAACRYCRGKTICPEARSAALAGPLEVMPPDITPSQLAFALNSQTLGDFLLKAAQAEAVIDACRAEARRRIAVGNEVPGWKLADGAKRESISQTQMVAERFLAFGTYDQLLPAITFTKTKLRESVQAATGLKGKALDQSMTDLLRDCTETKIGEPKLIRA